MEAARHHAHHRVGFLVEANDLTEDGRIPRQAPLPKARVSTATAAKPGLRARMRRA